MNRSRQSGRLDGNEAASKRVRAAKACKRCNAKRVKCDATVVGQPCSRCRRNGITECCLIDTRRGRYSRETMKSRAQEAADVLQNEEEAMDATSEPEGQTSADTPPRDVRSTTSAVDLDFTRGAEGGPPSENLEPYVSPDGDVLPLRPSYREVSWSAMFDHFLESHQNDRRDVIDKCSITYLGESFPLALVLGDLQNGGKTRLHHPGPPLLEAQTPATHSSPRVIPPHLLPEDINCLESKKCFDKPRSEVFDALINTFLDTYFPLYPIVHRQEFIGQYQNDTLPWILLHSCCFVAATFCPISVIHRAGFTGRKQARFSYYRKAKALFDTGHESNKVVLLQSVIMLTFWGGGPNAYWNFYSWIGTGCTIAETLGIHRSMAGTNIDAKDRSLLKRLWWILVIRDAFCASLVGRPLRINIDQGDTEMLTVQDFEHDIRSLQGSKHSMSQSFAHYQIQVAKLSLVLHRIVFTRFVPSPKRLSLGLLGQHIQQWRREVPAELDWDLPHSNLLANCLSILFDHHIILANLGLTNSRSNPGHDISLEQTPETAAQRISALASSIVVKSQSLSIPHETFQGVFLAGVVSYTQMRSQQPIVAQLGRTTLNNCELAMHDCLDAWDPAPWVSNLFDKLSSSISKSVNVVERDQGSERMEPHLNTDSLDFFDAQTFDYGLCSPWQSNPMLNTLFDWPLDNGSFQYQENGLSGSYMDPQ